MDLAPRPPRQSAAQRTLPQEQEEFLAWLLSRAGLDVRAYRRESLSRRLPAALRVLRADSLVQAKAVLHREPQQLEAAISALLIGVTQFFRDPAVFQAIDRVALASLCREDAPLRIWSVGCSDGPELYSVAMLLAERGRLQGHELLGTDCRPDALRAAFRGVYDAAAVADVPPDLLPRYFQPVPRGWAVQGWLRTVPQWRAANVLHRAQKGPWDLIICRNMAMYLQPPAAQRLWGELELVLRPGGYLWTGRAERPGARSGLVCVGPCLYQSSGG